MKELKKIAISSPAIDHINENRVISNSVKFK